MRFIVNVKFPLGQIVVTRSVKGLLSGDEINALLARHSTGDWGDMSRDDKEVNESALSGKGQLFSAYKTLKGEVWIITEADHSATTVLLPSEY